MQEKTHKEKEEIRLKAEKERMEIENVKMKNEEERRNCSTNCRRKRKNNRKLWRKKQTSDADLEDGEKSCQRVCDH